jgi:hypothetical protein
MTPCNYILYQQHSTSTMSFPLLPPPITMLSSNGLYRRPMLTVRNITSIQELGFFVKSVSQYVYQSTYTLAKPDIPYIENLLENDLLEHDINNVEDDAGSASVLSGES